MKPVICGMNNPKSADLDDAMEPYTPNGAGERLYAMVHLVCGCTKEQYANAFEMVNILEAKEWNAKSAAMAAGMFRFKMSGRRCFVLGKEAWTALRLPNSSKWFAQERTYNGSVYTLLPHPSGKNLMYNSATVRKKTGCLLARAGGFADVFARI